MDPEIILYFGGGSRQGSSGEAPCLGQEKCGMRPNGASARWGGPEDGKVETKKSEKSRRKKKEKGGHKTSKIRRNVQRGYLLA